MAWFERPEYHIGTESEVVWRRAAAVIIDSILIGIVIGAVGSIQAEAGLPRIVGSIGLFIGFGYFIYLEGNYGQTIGKMILDIVVVTEDGNPITYRSAAIRTLLRVIDVLPFFYIFGSILILVTKDKKRLGDFAAETVVVRAK